LSIWLSEDSTGYAVEILYYDVYGKKLPEQALGFLSEVDENLENDEEESTK